MAKRRKTQARTNVRRDYKARLFEMIFREKEELLGLYNAVNGTNYSNPDELEINTLENAIYLSMHNDILLSLIPDYRYTNTSPHTVRTCHFDICSMCLTCIRR